MKVKVKNAKALPHYKHDLSHDVSTTYDFGHLQPLMVRELSAGSKANLRVGQIVRLMNMVLPTFGRLTLNTYNVFVPMESIFHPYASLRAGQTYMGANARYVPQQVITCNTKFWSTVCKSMSTIYFYELNTPNETDFCNLRIDSLVSIGQITVSQYNAYRKEWLSSRMNNIDLFGSSYLGQYNAQSQLDGNPLPDGLDGFDWFDVLYIASANKNYLVAGKYHESARNLRKVLYGCGYKLIDDLEPLSMLPVFAYYKAWFDLFAPQRDITWKDTAAAGLQELMEQNGTFIFEDIAESHPDLVFRFIVDLCCTYYTQSPDFVSSHITGQRISTVANESVKTMDATGAVDEVVQTNLDNQGVSIGNAYNELESRLLNSSNLDLLMRLTHRINAKTVIGGKIRDFLRTQLGADYLDEDESYWIGSQKLDINITPVFSNAQTEQGFLGEFAGQGNGGTQGQMLNYETKVDGYWICMACIVPESRFAQGMDMQLKHVRKNDFYDSAFDSITLLPTAKKYIFAEQDFSVLSLGAAASLLGPQSTRYNSSFGNIPNYMEYCIAQNLQNGDMSLRSKRDSYLPFTLDKLLPYCQSIDLRTSALNSRYNLVQVNMNVVVNSTIWRYIGLYKWIGNYNRIFQNSGTLTALVAEKTPELNNMFYSVGFDDNFVGHNFLDFTVYSSKLPARDAYQTGAFDEGSVSLEKA